VGLVQSRVMRCRTQSWERCVDIEGDFVDEWCQLCKSCGHDVCEYHYGRNYSFWGERNGRRYLCVDLVPLP
jgi:hypothetical protein